MASISSILSILVQANTNDATTKLRQFDDKMGKTRAEAAKKIEAQLGANFDRRAFAEYDARLKATQDKIKNRAAFKAALGADFNPAAFNAYQRAVAKSESDTRRMSTSVDALAHRFTGAQNKMDGFNASMMMMRNVVGLMKWPAMIAGAGVATQAVGALASGVIALGSALAPLSGLGFAYAAGIAAVGQAAGVAKLALSGVHSGLTAYTKAQAAATVAQNAANAAASRYGKGSAQYKSAVSAQTTANQALQKSIAGLPPAQRSFVKELAGAEKQLNQLRNIAGANMFPGLTRALRDLQPLFGPLKTIVVATAKELGNLAAVAGKTVGGWGKDLATIGKTNVGVIHNLGMAAISLATALKDIIVVGGPLLTWMSSSVRTGADWVQQQIAAGRESGKLATFLAQTHAVMVQVWDIAKNLAVAFFDIGKSAAPLGRDLLNSIVLLTEKFREWTASTTGQNDMRKYFADMRAPIYAIAGLVKDLGGALVHLSAMPGLTHVINDLRKLVPVLQNLISSTTQGFSSSFIDAFTNVAKLFAQLAGSSGPLTLLAKGIGWVAGAISKLLQSSPGFHSAVVDMVGMGAAVKALSLIPKLPVIGSLISLFTASGRAKSLASLLSFGGVKNGGGLLGKLSGKSMTVATMEVGTLIAKTTLGGGGLPSSGTPAKNVEKTAAKDAEKAGVKDATRAAGRHFVQSLPVIGQLAMAAPAVAAMLKAYLPGWSPVPHPSLNTTNVNDIPDIRSVSGMTPAQPHFAIPGVAGPTQLGAAGAKLIPQSASIRQATQDFLQMNGALSKLEQHQAGIKQTAVTLDELARNAKKAGDVKWQMADTLGAELLRTHNVASQGVMSLLGQLNRLTPGAQAAAGQAMVQMTQTLETQGKVPLGSTARLVTEMLGQYSTMRDKSGIEFRGLMGDASQTMNTLRQRIATSTGQQRQQAISEYDRLRASVGTDFSQMADTVSTKQAGMTKAIAGGSQKAADEASTNLYGYEQSVYQAMSQGLLSSNQGASLITKALNATLKAFGAKQIPMPTAVSGLSAPGKGLHAGANAAQGGLFQIGRAGEAGRDNVPLNVGGFPVMVAPGEQVAVFNRHQLPIVNAALAPMGGLPGLFNKVSRPNYMASGGMVPGFAGGGSIGYGQLEGLWDKAGGPPSMAALMAAIAEAESGGNPNARNASGASGLWQILGLPFPGNVFDPLTNARMAVAKFVSQGLGAWVTYTSGAYKSFLNGGVPPSALGAIGMQGITAPKVGGTGTIADMVRSALGKATGAANSYLSRMAPSGGVASIAGLPSGVGVFDGKPVDNWIIPILRWARGHGWAGAVTSGYRTPAQQIAAAEGYGLSHYGAAGPLGSNHIKTAYPGGAVDVSAAAQLAAVLSGYPGRPNLVWGGPVMGDEVHFSADGHARGGMVKFGGAFKNGGVVPGPAGQPTMILAHGGETVVPTFAGGGIISNPYLSQWLGRGYTPGVVSNPFLTRWLGLGYAPPSMPSVGTVGTAPGSSMSIAQLTGMPGLPTVNGPIPTTAAGAGQLQGKITGMRSQIDGLEHQYSIFDQFYNLETLNFVDPNTGEVDQAAVQKRVQELNTLIGIRMQIFQLWGQVVVHTQRLVASNQAILGRLLKEAAGKSPVSRLTQAIADSKTHIAQMRTTLANLSTRGLKGSALASVEAHRRQLRDAITSAETHQRDLTGDLAKARVHQRDVQSGIVTYRGRLASARGDLTSAGDDRDSAWLSVLQLQGERAGVLGTQPQTSSVSAATASTVAAAASPVQGQTVQDLQTLLTQTSQTLAISQAQYSAIQGMPQFGGSFANGGVVPGPTGQPRTIIAHGGEIVGHGQPIMVTVVVQDGAVDPNKIQAIAEGAAVKITRGQTALARRRLPGGA